MNVRIYIYLKPETKTAELTEIAIIRFPDESCCYADIKYSDKWYPESNISSLLKKNKLLFILSLPLSFLIPRLRDFLNAEIFNTNGKKLDDMLNKCMKKSNPVEKHGLTKFF